MRTGSETVMEEKKNNGERENTDGKARVKLQRKHKREPVSDTMYSKHVRVCIGGCQA